MAAGYSGGRISRIKIKNFMTYDEVEIFPKNGLNLIVGLNGSGKSSIMCAICLGLAGKAQFTGRTSVLSEFVKHGQEEAEILIELESMQDSNVTIVRKIRGEKSEWYFNKRTTNQTEVAKAVKHFNIDPSNLCQFLPQEKVVEFSRMDKKQRLENMLQSIGEPRLFVLFNELKEMFKKCTELEMNIKKSQNTKGTAEEKNERISDEVQKQEDRVRLKKQLDDFLNIKLVLEYGELKNEITELKSERKVQERELRKATAERDEKLKVNDEIRKRYLRSAESLRENKSQVQDLNSKLHKLTENAVVGITEQIENAKMDYTNKLKEKESQKKRLKDIERQIEILEQLYQEELKKKPAIDEALQVNSAKLMQVFQDINECYKTTENASIEKNSLLYSMQNLQKQLAALQDASSKKLNTLKRMDKYTYEAVLWVNENKHKFKSTIYLPIMLEVKVNSNAHSKYIENHIPMRDMVAFVCEDKEDCKRLTDILKNQKKLPVNIIMASDAPLSSFQSYKLSSEFKNYGLQGFLIDFISAPEPVLRYLCQCYGVHRIPVSSSNIDQSKIDTILQTFKLFFAGNIKISGKQSRYGDRNWSVKRDFISDKNLLSNHDDSSINGIQQKLDEITRQLQDHTAKHEQLKNELLEKDRYQESLRQEKQTLLENSKQLQKITNNLVMKKNFRRQISTVTVSEEEERDKLTQKVQELIAKKQKALEETIDLFKDVFRLQKDATKTMLNMNALSKELKFLKAANDDICEQVNSLEHTIKELSKKINEKMEPAKKLLATIQSMTMSISNAQLNTTLDEIEDKISHVQAQLNLNEDNEPLIKEFNARKKQIEAIEANINELETSVTELRNEIEKKKREFIDPLQYHITNINKKFSKYFKHLSCAGEISLDIPENENDFSLYGLQIKLKFHDDQPMTELSTTRHSGGECSVAAIVFILSLQELTEVPFRCIDEINQGMDSIYERKIFQLIADSVSNDKCSQYFLLTPKLLMDLKYPEDVAVHVIYNSNFLYSKFNVREVLDAYKPDD